MNLKKFKNYTIRLALTCGLCGRYKKSVYLTGITIFLIGFLVLNISLRYDWGLPESADIYIQAGHEGRVGSATGAASTFGKEIDWTPIVADEATKILRNAGIRVIRAKADRRRLSRVKLALSIHFDGNHKQCRTGASIGYDDPTDKPAADHWREIYSEYFPFKWMNDNFTKNLSNYYNFKYTMTKDAELLLELGDITCEQQAKWMKKRLKHLGQIVAFFASQRIGNQSIAKPQKI